MLAKSTRTPRLFGDTCLHLMARSGVDLGSTG